MKMGRDLDRAVAVALFVFNRPEILEETLSNLEQNGIPKMYVFADGARNSSDEEGVRRVREIIDAIKWCKVEKKYMESNQGLSESIKSGLSKVFKNEDAVIVIEDDVCVSPNFYEYMVSALSTYQKDQKIAGVTGLRYPFSRNNIDKIESDVFLAPRFSSWGWGTWKDRWQNIEFDVGRLMAQLKGIPEEQILMGGADLKNSYDAVREGKLSGCWDFYYYLNMTLKKKYFVWPKYSFVTNNDIGGGTHASLDKPDWQLHWENTSKYNFDMPNKLKLNDNIVSDFLEFFDRKQGNERNSLNMKAKLKSVASKLGYDVHKISKDAPKDPAEYSTVGSLEVPCQKESYFYALNNYVKEGDRVLDVGMGIGYGMNLLSIKAKEVYAVDVDKAAVESCSKTVLGKNPKVKELKHYDGYHLPYKDNFFDLVTCVDVVEHVQDYDKFIDELLRVAKRAVFFATPNRRPEYTNPDGTPKNHWHLREWSFPELDKIVRSHAKSVDWAFLDGPWEGPFKTVKKVTADTLVLMPTLIVKR